jgi:hypothetical protein
MRNIDTAVWVDCRQGLRQSTGGDPRRPHAGHPGKANNHPLFPFSLLLLLSTPERQRNQRLFRIRFRSSADTDPA